MAEAEKHERLGDFESARRYYEQAAEQEAQAFRTLEGAGERTRSVLALSAVALYSRAGNHADGIHLAYEVLAAQRLLPAATTEIEEVLDDLRNLRAAAELGLNRVSDHLEWVLRGPGVGAGMATLDAISQKIGQIERLGVRVYEFILAHPLRRHGPPASEIGEGVRILIGQPAAGSFRFGLQFADRDVALPMFEDAPPLHAKTLTSTFATIVDAAQQPNEEERLAEIVPAEDYRETFLKLVRNLIPDGREINEIELRRGSESRAIARLIPPTRQAISRYLRSRRPERPGEQEIIGPLRALDLNDRWVRIGREATRKVAIPESMAIEDLIGPLVNRRVRVTVHRVRNALVADDIEEEPDGSKEDTLGI